MPGKFNSSGQDYPTRFVSVAPGQNANTQATAAGMETGPWVMVMAVGTAGGTGVVTFTSYAATEDKIGGALTDNSIPVGVAVPILASNVSVTGANNVFCYLKN